jgi:hypothetical protein
LEETIMKHAQARFVVAAAALLALGGCSGGGGSSSGGPVPAAGGSTVQLAGADILIGGQSVSGATITQGAGPSTLFTTTLVDPANTTQVRTMSMDYPAHSSMGMMGYMDTVQLYDDGTHGDLVPGDGRYSYMDVNGHIGPDGTDCPRGDYLYTFHGTDIMGHDTNSIDCHVTVK